MTGGIETSETDKETNLQVYLPKLNIIQQSKAQVPVYQLSLRVKIHF